MPEQALVKKENDFADDLMDAAMFAFMTVGMLLVMVPAFVKMVEKSSTFIQSWMYGGAVDSKVLNADEDVKWINLAETGTPWVAADFYNYGPDKVYIGINTPGPWTEKMSGEGFQVNMMGAVRRIEVIFYRCEVGKEATVKVDGKY